MKNAADVVVVSALYSSFWFFQAGQLQKAVQAKYPSLTCEAFERNGLHKIHWDLKKAQISMYTNDHYYTFTLLN